jgi:hypothetical protein
MGDLHEHFETQIEIILIKDYLNHKYVQYFAKDKSKTWYASKHFLISKITCLERGVQSTCKQNEETPLTSDLWPIKVI